MNLLMLFAWLATGLVHLGLPLAYFLAMNRVSHREGSFHLDQELEHPPSVTILVPTYNEAAVIQRKIENISRVDYPKEKIELVIVDAGSTDGTVVLAKKVLEQTGVRGVLVEEGSRKGKAAGLNQGLDVATGELVCISDAECEWDTRALRNAARYLSDPSIGSVSGVHRIRNPQETLATQVEDSYRSLYRLLRVAESKLHSTPVAEGELQLFRRRDLGAFDTKIGGDDTDAALTLVSKGLRSISAEDVVFFEPTPTSWHERFRQKIRRGQHILQAFLKHKNLLFSGKSSFSRLIFPMEFFLYVLNPVLLIPFLILTTLTLIEIPLLATIALIALGLVLLVPRLRRLGTTYLTNNLTMLAALVQEARGAKQLQWTKISETRQEKPRFSTDVIPR